jgi:hypothetical protein
MARGEPLAPRIAGHRPHKATQNARRLMLGVIASCGIGVGVVAGSATIGSMKGQGPSLTAPMNIPWDTDYEAESRFALEVDRGRGWASMAYLAGLRKCPDPSPAFLQGCQARMAEEEESARALAASRAEDERQYAAETQTFDDEYREPRYADPVEQSWNDLRHAAVQDLERPRPSCAGECATEPSEPSALRESASTELYVTEPPEPAWRSLAAPTAYAEQVPAETVALSSASLPPPVGQ